MRFSFTLFPPSVFETGRLSGYFRRKSSQSLQLFLRHGALSHCFTFAHRQNLAVQHTSNMFISGVELNVLFKVQNDTCSE